MIHHENVKSPSPNDNSTDSTNKDFLQSPEVPIEELMADLADRVEQEERKAKRQRRRKKKSQSNLEPYKLINITFEEKNHAEVNGLICLLAYRTLKTLPLTPSKTYEYSHITNTTALHRKTQHHAFKRLWWGIFRSHNKKKYKDRRQFDGCNTHSYKDKPDIHILCYLQGHNCAYDGNIYPSRETIAKHLNISIRRVDKSLKNLVREGDVHIKSGKADYRANNYYIDVKYQKHPLMNPSDYEHPFAIRCILNNKIKKSKCHALKNWIKKHFRREKKDFAHQSFQDIKQIRTCLRNQEKDLQKSAKKSKDPPNNKKKPLFMKLLKEFNFSMRDNFVLSQYGEAPLRSAMDDYKFYKKDHEVKNPVAFICGQCKRHRKRLGLLTVRTPAEQFKYFVNKSKKLQTEEKAVFIQDNSEIDRNDNNKLYIKILKHKSNPAESILYLWKRVNGYWVDKRIAFTNNRFEELVEPFLRAY